MTADRTAKLARLQKVGGYKFRETALLHRALVHSSYTNEERAPGVEDNERLEFLGDAVLQLVISDYLLRHFPHLREGELSKKRSALVREEALKTAAEQLGLGRYLILGRGEEATGGRAKPSILAGTLEAVIGAIYLDGGYAAAAGIIETWLKRFLKAGLDEVIFRSDYKSRLQELCQSLYHESPEYVVISQTGPDHRKFFEVGARLRGEMRGFGQGHSKKEAEQNAARDALVGLEASLSKRKA